MSHYVLPGPEHLLRCAVEIVRTQEHCLEYEIPLEAFKRFDYECGIVFAYRFVDKCSKGRSGRIEFQNGIVHLPEGRANFRNGASGGIGQDRDLGRRHIFIPQSNGYVYNFSKVGVERRLSVAGKGYGIYFFPG